MEENGQNLFENYLRLLNLRLYSLSGLCPAENREDVRSRMAMIANPDLDQGAELNEEDARACKAMMAELNQLIAEKRSEEPLPRIELLRQIFDLDSREMVLMTAVLAAAVDDRFRALYSLFRNGEDPRMELLLGLIADSGIERYQYANLLGNDGILLKYALLETVGGVSVPDQRTAYRLAPGLLSWLNGEPSVEVYEGRGSWTERSSDIVDILTQVYSAAKVLEAAESGSEPMPIVSFNGPDENLLVAAAAALGNELNRPLLWVDLRGLDFTQTVRLMRFAFRDALLNDGLAVFYGLDSWIDSSGVIPAELGQLFNKWDDPVILLTGKPFVFSSGSWLSDRLVLRITVPGLTGSRRFDFWKKQLSGVSVSVNIDDEELRTLAGQFTLNTAQIVSALNAGQGIAVTELRPLTIADLYEGARVSSMHHLSDLAKRIETRYTLEDLVLPDKQTLEIEQLIAMARNRSMVLEDWGIEKKLVSGRGISALFTGVPGTGKTLTAQVIAGELGLDLYRVDLSTIVSKYIGETEKNLERVFTEAQNSNVILFFDEADSLFGRRSEVGDSHDRYANIEVGYLLQRIETYDGIVLMATNLGANLDEAFARRINFIIDFPFPDEEIRFRLWKLLLPDYIEKDDDIELWPFAAAYKITGGNIRNAVVWAVYEAARNKRPLSADDLMKGVEREYQKMGKVFQRIS